MQIQNFFFDLDGTLINSEPGLFSAHTHCLEELRYMDGLKILVEEGIRWSIGPPLSLTIPRLIGSEDAEQVQHYIDTFQRAYQQTYYKDFILYDGIAELLPQLKQRGHNLFVCTSKPELIARRIMEYLQYDSLLCDLIGSELDERAHEKSDFLRELCRRHGCRPEQSAMIGDRSYDMKAGKALDFAACIGVSYGFGSEEELWDSGAHYTVKRALDILDFAG